MYDKLFYCIYSLVYKSTDEINTVRAVTALNLGLGLFTGFLYMGIVTGVFRYYGIFILLGLPLGFLPFIFNNNYYFTDDRVKGIVEKYSPRKQLIYKIVGILFLILAPIVGMAISLLGYKYGSLN